MDFFFINKDIFILCIKIKVLWYIMILFYFRLMNNKYSVVYYVYNKIEIILIRGKIFLISLKILWMLMFSVYIELVLVI